MMNYNKIIDLHQKLSTYESTLAENYFSNYHFVINDQIVLERKKLERIHKKMENAIEIIEEIKSNKILNHRSFK